MGERMKILIGYDGSECAEAALQDLSRAGLPAEADVLIMSVADVFPGQCVAQSSIRSWNYCSKDRPLRGARFD